MTDNADLIAELRGFAAGSESARASLMRDAADALEAVVQERDNWKLSAEEAERAEKRWKDRAHDYSTERDQIAAVVEKVRAYLGAGKGAYAPDLLDILATAPADALREHDAKVRAEAQAEVLRIAADGLHAGVRGSKCNAACHEADQITLRIRADRIEREAGLK